MADDDRIEIEVVLADGQVAKGFANIKRSGDDTASSLNKSFLSVTKTIAGIAAAYLSVRAIKGIFSTAIEGAINQENAINKLNSSLALAGRFSREASLDFQAFASEIQNTTKIGDDVTLGLLSIANNFAKTNEQAKALTKAAIDLSSATGKDLNSSLETLGKTLQGSAGRLGQQVAGVAALTKEQLKAGAAIDLVAARFAGSAANEVNTFSGRLTQLKNIFGDVLEEAGLIITRSPALLAVFKFLSEQLSNLGNAIKGFGSSSDDALKPLIQGVLSLADALTFVLGGSLELVFNAFRIGLNVIRTGIQTLVTGFAGLAANLVGFFAPNSDLANGLRDFRESSGAVLNDLALETGENFKNAFNFDATNATRSLIAGAQDAVAQAGPLFNDLKNSATGALGEIEIKAFTLGQTLTAVFGDGGTFDQAVKEFAANSEKNFKQIGQQAFQFIGTATANAFASFGKALATGENALEGFLNSLLASFGQAAVQLGTQFILQGAAYLFAGLPNGGALIAAGSALATFGGILSGLSGASSPTATTSQAGAVTPELSQPQFEEPDIDERSRGTVTVNIMGDVLDSRESGLRIIELINDSFNKDGARLVGV